jgi:hypothetical protein
MGIHVAHMEAGQKFWFLFRANFSYFLWWWGVRQLDETIKKVEVPIYFLTGHTTSNQTASGSSSVISCWRWMAPCSWHNCSPQQNITTCLKEARCILYC